MLKAQFFDQLTQSAIQYDIDNQWFGFHRGGPKWSKGTWIQFILAAWKLYQNASRNQLQMILLGDTKIRSDASLLFNFGLAANTNTPQEEKDKQLVSDLMYKRRKIHQGGEYWDNRDKKPVEMMGPGSILSAKRWSPMLNDALMLAGILRRQEFHFALNSDEGAIWQNLRAQHIGGAQFQKRRAVFGSAVNTASQPALSSEQALCLKFFHKVPRVLWENGKPRVFVRELLGLKLFGYKPVFNFDQVSFIYSGGGKKPTFQNYLTGLREAGFNRRNRVSIMRSLSEFLFDDLNALRTIGD